MQRERAPRILAIDDLADRDHDCDMLLDQNLVLDMERRYRGRLPATCKPLLGPPYALLRREFAEQRKSLTAAQRQGRPHPGVLWRLRSRQRDGEGACPPSRACRCPACRRCRDRPEQSACRFDLAALCADMPRAELHRGADNMAELMKRADLAIGAGGVMSWERCCLALPTIAVDIADNQIGALTALAGAARSPISVQPRRSRRNRWRERCDRCWTIPRGPARWGGRTGARRRAGHLPGAGGDAIDG